MNCDDIFYIMLTLAFIVVVLQMYTVSKLNEIMIDIYDIKYCRKEFNNDDWT